LVSILFLLEDTGSEVKKQENASSEYNLTEDGRKYIVHPSELRQGCPGMDCIPSIDDPKYEDVSEAGWMNPGDEIMAVEVNGTSRAYPLRIMDSHEIVNTEVNGKPVVVTYCPLCRSGVTFSRKVGGEVLEFGVSGKLRNANLVMYDRQSETYWSQIGGKAIIGPKVPQELDLIFSSVTNWSKWSEEHPDGEVLSTETGIRPPSAYESRNYLERGYSNPQRYGAENIDDRLDETELVHGLRIGNGSKAYPEDQIREKGFIQDEVGGKSIMILEKPDGSITAFSREVKGEVKNFSIENGKLVGSEGKSYKLNGEQIGGETELTQFTPRGFYWFAWSKFNPETEIYKESN
jgi:hypothetical protein